MMTPRLIYGKRQVESAISVVNIASYMDAIHGRIADIPPDVQKLFELLMLENANLAYTIGGYELLERVFDSFEKNTSHNMKD